MAVRKFAGEEELEPFREWVAQKPKGVVLNTDSGLSDRGSTRLHRASCFTLEPGFGGSRRQTVDYIKVCSPEPKELNEWAVGNLGYGLRSLALPSLRADAARANRLTRASETSRGHGAPDTVH